MKLIQKIKKVSLLAAALAVLMIPASGYSWTHDQAFGRHGTYQGHHGSHYSHGYQGGHRYYNHGGWGWNRHYPVYGHYYSPQDLSYAVPFGIYLPGFSFYVGP